MKAFLRALGYAWPYRWRVGAAWLCGLVAAMMWAGSLSAILPMFNVLFQPPPQGLRFVERPAPEPDQPGRVERLLEADERWAVVEDPAAETVAVEGRTVRVPRGTLVVRLRGGLESLAAQAEAKGESYAPLARWLAGVLPKDRHRCLLAILGAVVAMMAVRGAMDYASEYLVGHAATRGLLALRLRVYEHVLRSRLSLFARTSASDIMSRFQQDCFFVEEGAKTVLGKAVVMPPRAVLCLVPAVVLGVSIDPWLPVAVFVAVPLVAVLVRQFARLVRRSSRKALESLALLMGTLEESLFGIRIVKGYRLEGYQRRRFFQWSRRLLRNLLRGLRVQAVTGPAVETIFTVAAAVAVAIGGKIVMEQSFEMAGLGELTTFFALLVGALDPMRKLSNVSNRVQQAAAGAERVFALLESDLEPRYGTRGRDLPRHRESLEFRGVSFAYERGKPVLEDVTLTVRHGEVVAIVGRTGCGKTTLVSLVPRFFEPDAGEIRLDGVNLRDATLRSLRDQIAVVPQEPILFADTIGRNIAVGAISLRDRPPPTRQDVERAAKAAHADEFIRRLPDGYDTPVGEHGLTLSGGERQRLALARAIIRDPAILVLDEATSALDEETQTLVQEALQAFVRGRTTLLIAHRLSTLAIAHRIVVMEAGRIVAVGTHEDLLASCPLYRRLREVGLDRA
jgi:ABC-type multidrug transport system fused ATPase/permease subunit